MHWKTGGALCAAAALIASGCGGSGTLSRAEFVKQANAICTGIEGQSLALFKDAQARAAAHTAGHETTASLRAKASSYRQDELDRMRALHPPATLQSDFDDWQTTLRTIYRMGARTITPAVHARYKALVEHEHDLKAHLGLTSCR